MEIERNQDDDDGDDNDNDEDNENVSDINTSADALMARTLLRRCRRRTQELDKTRCLVYDLNKSESN